MTLLFVLGFSLFFNLYSPRWLVLVPVLGLTRVFALSYH